MDEDDDSWWWLLFGVMPTMSQTPPSQQAPLKKESSNQKEKQFRLSIARKYREKSCPCYTVVVVMTVAKHQATVAPSEVSPHSQPRVTVKVQYTHLHPQYYFSCILFSPSLIFFPYLGLPGWRVTTNTALLPSPPITSRIDSV